MSPLKPARSQTVGVVRLAHAEGLPLPAYQSEEAAGLDLVAAVSDHQPMTLAPGVRALVPTGLVIELPPGMEAQVRPRSGLALKHGITVLNSPGTIDSDYRGEVKVLLVNLGDAPFTVTRGERIAQLIVATVTRIELAVRKKAGQTRRGAGGFGSTGSAPSATKTKAKPKPNPKSKSKAKSKPSSVASKRTAKRKSVPKTPSPGKRFHR